MTVVILDPVVAVRVVTDEPVTVDRELAARMLGVSVSLFDRHIADDLTQRLGEDGVLGFPVRGRGGLHDWVERHLEPPAVTQWPGPRYRSVGARRERKPIPAELRAAVYERDGHRCVRCRATDWLALDHREPHIAGGPDTFENLQTLCRSCNSRKGARRG